MQLYISGMWTHYFIGFHSGDFIGTYEWGEIRLVSLPSHIATTL